MTQSLPVLIIGAGPVGLSLALRLAQQNIRVQVFEALPEINPQSRASTFHPPTLEMFEAWGIWPDIQRDAEIVREVFYYRREPLEMVAAFHFGLIDSYTSHPYRIHYPQHRLTQVLYRHLTTQQPDAVNFEHRLGSFVDHGDHVEATFETPDGTVKVNGALICAADGARSGVRNQLDIGFEGRDFEDRFLLIDSMANVTAQIPSIAPVMYLFDPTDWLILKLFKNAVRFVFRLGPDDDAELMRERKLAYARVERFLPELSHNIQNVYVYGITQRVADTFNVGRVLLVGDAAHTTNPIGGMGLNSGIHDAAFLADIIPTVLSGEQGIDAFALYTKIRRSVAMESVHATADADYADMTAQSHHDIIARDNRLQEIATNLDQARDYLLRSSMLQDRIPNK